MSGEDFNTSGEQHGHDQSGRTPGPMQWQVETVRGERVTVSEHRRVEGELVLVGEDGGTFVTVGGLRVATVSEVRAQHPDASLRDAIRWFRPPAGEPA